MMRSTDEVSSRNSVKTEFHQESPIVSKGIFNTENVYSSDTANDIRKDINITDMMYSLMHQVFTTKKRNNFDIPTCGIQAGGDCRRAMLQTRGFASQPTVLLDLQTGCPAGCSAGLRQES